MHKNADLVDDILELFLGQGVEVAAEAAVDGLQKSSIRVLLKNLRPFEEQLEGLAILLSVDFLAVDDIDLCDQRLVLFNIVLERFSQVISLLFVLGQVGLILQDKTGVADFFL